MNGGTFTPGTEKKRPGIYFNFKTTAAYHVRKSWNPFYWRKTGVFSAQHNEKKVYYLYCA